MAKRCCIKLAWRHNLIYPSMLLIWVFLRKINTILLDKFFSFSKNLLFTLLMFVSEIFAGSILYFYHKSFLNKKKIDNSLKNVLIFTGEEEIPYSKIKIYFLIFVAGSFDFINFILSTNYIPKYSYSSSSLDIRLGGIVTIISALFFYYLLKLPILRHQLFSIYAITICLILTISLEYYFQDIDVFISYGYFSLKILLILIKQFFLSLIDAIEKYVVDYNNLNLFKVLAFEGIFGSIITVLYLFVDDSYQIQLKEIYDKKSSEMFALFIFLLFVYIIFSGLKNTYRVITNKIYSPMTKSLTDYFLNPIFLIQNYFEDDFKSGGKQNVIYFLINFILCIITDFFGSVFNEIIILFFCGFETNTHNQVSYRSIINYKKVISEINGNIDNESEKSERSESYIEMNKPYK